MQIEEQCSKNYYKVFLPQEAAAFENNIEKETQEARPKLKKYVYCIFTENISSICNQIQVIAFLLKNVLIF